MCCETFTVQLKFLSTRSAASVVAPNRIRETHKHTCLKPAKMQSTPNGEVKYTVGWFFFLFLYIQRVFFHVGLNRKHQSNVLCFSSEMLLFFLFSNSCSFRVVVLVESESQSFCKLFWCTEQTTEAKVRSHSKPEHTPLQWVLWGRVFGSVSDAHN